MAPELIKAYNLPLAQHTQSFNNFSLGVQGAILTHSYSLQHPVSSLIALITISNHILVCLIT